MIFVAVVLWTLVAGIVLLAIWGGLIEPNRLETSELRVPLPRLPQSLEGLSVGHLSDWHLSGRRAALALAERSCREIMARSPDLICLTGDLVTELSHLPTAAALLRTLSAPLGVFLVLGNHDCNATMEDLLYGHLPVDTAEDLWREALAGSGLTLLHNETRAISFSGGRVVVAGVGDTTAGRDDLPLTVSAAPEGDLRILLSHSPDVLDDPAVNWADLVLSGHTHGGQLVLPGWGSVWAPVWRLRHRASGLWRLNGTVAFITRGVGSGLRARINCPPQAAILRLVPGSAAEIPATRQVQLSSPSEVSA